MTGYRDWRHARREALNEIAGGVVLALLFFIVVPVGMYFSNEGIWGTVAMSLILALLGGLPGALMVTGGLQKLTDSTMMLTVVAERDNPNRRVVVVPKGFDSNAQSFQLLIDAGARTPDVYVNRIEDLDTIGSLSTKKKVWRAMGVFLCTIGIFFTFFGFFGHGAHYIADEFRYRAPQTVGDYLWIFFGPFMSFVGICQFFGIKGEAPEYFDLNNAIEVDRR